MKGEDMTGEGITGGSAQEGAPERDAIARLVRDLRTLGIDGTRPVLVHSSVKALGPVHGGLRGIMAALREAVAPATLLVPALSYDRIDWGDPVFSVRDTPTCIGAFPEFFRKQPGVLRSRHITHSVCALGDDAEWYTGEHHLDHTPGGKRSPFRRLAEKNGMILMLGCGLGPNTTMHAVEEVSEPPYLFLEGLYSYRIVSDDGSEKVINARTRRHDFHGFWQRYDRVEQILESGSELRIGRVGRATAHLISAFILFERATARIRNEPFFFVDRTVEDRTDSTSNT